MFGDDNDDDMMAGVNLLFFLCNLWDEGDESSVFPYYII